MPGPLLSGSPFEFRADQEQAIGEQVSGLQQRLRRLREAGRLTEDALRRYYGDRRFEQVAESNALEGSTLSVGDTQLAILKGLTLVAGHDPAYVRDALALNRALEEVLELARCDQPLDQGEARQLHQLILGGSEVAGLYRTQKVILTGSAHVPPKTLAEIARQMADWERWSVAQADAPKPLRALVLHAWFTQVHPFVDGNGRTARALTTLELVRGGFPPLILRRKADRSRYLAALAEADAGGDLGPLADLLLERLEGAVLGLENALRETQGYDPVRAKLRERQTRRLHVWNTGVELLRAALEDRLAPEMAALGGRVESRVFTESLELDQYLALCGGQTIPRGWAFSVALSVPGAAPFRRLAWHGLRSATLRQAMPDDGGGPALLWSAPNPAGYPQWTPSGPQSPYALEASTPQGEGDRWFVRRAEGAGIEELGTSELVRRIAEALLGQMAEGA